MRFSYAESMCDPAQYLPLAMALEQAGWDGFIVPMRQPTIKIGTSLSKVAAEPTRLTDLGKIDASGNVGLLAIGASGENLRGFANHRSASVRLIRSDHGHVTTGHYHVYLDEEDDDADHITAWSDSVVLALPADIAPGPHTIRVSLRAPDHHAVGVEDSITIEVE